MASVIKISDTSYKINVSAGDISGSFSGDSFESINTHVGETSGKIIGATIAVEFSVDAADIIRRRVASELTLGMDMGDKLAENKYLEALFCSPVPFSSIFGGEVPSLTVDDDIDISGQLDNLSSSREINFGEIQIGMGDTYRLKFIPDARGFEVFLENIDLDDNLEEDHAFALTRPFVISTLDLDNPIVQDGVPPGSTHSSVDDAKVMFYEKELPVSGGEVLTRAIALSMFRDKGMIRDAYNALFSLPLWRSSGVEVTEKGGRPYTSHLCGVDPYGTSIQYLQLEGLTATTMIGSANLTIRGNAVVKFLVGDIRYPVKPFFGIGKILFDICIDDPGWTDVGPLASQYIGGDGTTGENIIH